MADDMPGPKSLYFTTPLVFNSPGGGVPLGRFCYYNKPQGKNIMSASVTQGGHKQHRKAHYLVIHNVYFCGVFYKYNISHGLSFAES